MMIIIFGFSFWEDAPAGKRKKALALRRIDAIRRGMGDRGSVRKQ